jgi:hypothetical protein
MPHSVGCGTACGVPSDCDFGLKPIVEVVAVLMAARFVELVGTATNLLFELLFCWSTRGSGVSFIVRAAIGSSLTEIPCWSPETKEAFLNSSRLFFYPSADPVCVQPSI